MSVSPLKKVKREAAAQRRPAPGAGTMIALKIPSYGMTTGNHEEHRNASGNLRAGPGNGSGTPGVSRPQVREKAACFPLETHGISN